MAINIDDRWWTDPRRSTLIKISGGDEIRADGLALNLWRLGHSNYKKGFVISEKQFSLVDGNKFLLEAELMVQVENGYYIKGCEKHGSWRVKKHEGQKKGGKNSATAKTKKYGTPFPNTPKLNRSYNEVKRSSPKSLSLSLSLKNNNTIMLNLTIERAYKLFPRKQGKSKGMKSLKTQITTEAEANEFFLATTNYVAYCKTQKLEPRYIKHFSTFVSEWRDWLDPDVAQEKPENKGGGFSECLQPEA